MKSLLLTIIVFLLCNRSLTPGISGRARDVRCTDKVGLRAPLHAVVRVCVLSATCLFLDLFWQSGRYRARFIYYFCRFYARYLERVVIFSQMPTVTTRP